METVSIWNENKSLKFCKCCEDYVEVINFYHLYDNVYATLCKKHWNEQRKVNRLKKNPKKILGFMALSETVRNDIINDYNNNKISLLKISKKYNLKYQALLTWQDKIKLPSV